MNGTSIASTTPSPPPTATTITPTDTHTHTCDRQNRHSTDSNNTDNSNINKTTQSIRTDCVRFRCLNHSSCSDNYQCNFSPFAHGCVSTFCWIYLARHTNRRAQAQAHVSAHKQIDFQMSNNCLTKAQAHTHCL